MAIIIFAGIQPPNDWALPITVGFIVLSLIIWVLFENRRFKGPPIGDEIATPSGRDQGGRGCPRRSRLNPVDVKNKRFAGWIERSGPLSCWALDFMKGD